MARVEWAKRCVGEDGMGSGDGGMGREWRVRDPPGS